MKDEDLRLLETLFMHYERDTMYSFNSSRIETSHPYYKFIVALGQKNPDDIVPWLLDKIDNYHSSFSWCFALREIVGPIDSPVIIPEMAGKVAQIKMLWQDWGRTRHYGKLKQVYWDKRKSK